jgi:tRNA threonylcarbamoyladenosine biosynthesis protein TsaB
MLVLGIDTSNKNGSIALVECDPSSSRTLAVAPLEGGTFSAQLIPQISRLLESHGLRKQDIGALAVASGPGSFTGLRVGLAAAKGLGEILQKPIASVSRLEAIALAAGRSGRVVAALDAGRGEIYCGEYELTGSGAALIKQELRSAEQFLAAGRDVCVVTPDGPVATLAAEHEFPVVRIDPPQADVIARLGFQKIRAGEITSVEALDANYIRASDAEIKRTRAG